MLSALEASPPAASGPTYSRDIRPILAKHCLKCHGPDEATREADLRLDSFDHATADLGGYQAIKPGDPANSEVIRRITTSDPDAVMPPPAAKLPLTDGQIELLQQWIEAGGIYERHWAFEPPTHPSVPAINNPGWAINPIDHFVAARHEAEGLEAAPEADPYTLVRRVYLDLIGLPPTPEQADTFIHDSDPDAYERLVDRLLESPRYGERWARAWLDLARYADTNGYEKDRPRSIWPYRDWVINALNQDMPFDQFTIEQLAGDLLPEATLDQRIATGFHRNTMLNEEGGIDPLEYRFYAMVDRVATTATVWMGMTVECAQCHTHKFDPITHTDYYGMMALLNNADEPDLQVTDAEIAARRHDIERQIETRITELPNRLPAVQGEGPEAQRRQQSLERQFTEWLTEQRSMAHPWQPLAATALSSNLPKLETLGDRSVFSSGDITKRDVFDLTFDLSPLEDPLTAIRLEVLPDPRLPAGGPGRCYYEGRKGDFFLSELTAKIDGSQVEFAAGTISYGKLSIGSGAVEAKNVFDGEGSTGWSTSDRPGEPHQMVLNLSEPVSGSSLEIQMIFERHFAASLGRFRFSGLSSDKSVEAKEAMPVDIETLLAQDPDTLTSEQRSRLKAHFLSVAPELAEANQAIVALRRQLPELPMTMVMQERPTDNPRPTHRHHRGEYLQPREEVAPEIPSLFTGLPESTPRNRLSFARWLVSDRNPLVGRVTVNRAWQAIFGRGIVKTAEDFGTQSDLPTHPELLDWLAIEFMKNGGSMKDLHRLIVTSATYRQSSRVTDERWQQDPENRWLTRGPRFRLEAEIIRDATLSVSGLLSDKMGGPGVYPPQPGQVTAIAYGNTPWNPDSGADRYRRSIYTFAKRTAPFAAYTTFDAPTGEQCVARRPRSNTPLQALTLLNDAMFLEAAQALARSADARTKHDSELREVGYSLFRQVLTRPPTEAEIDDLLAFYQDQQRRLESGELSAEEIMGTENAPSFQAAWALVARVLLNLDETITKP